MTTLRAQPAQVPFLSSPADIAIFGGAAGGGKSYAALLEPLRHVHNPRFGAVVFRRTYPEIMGTGGLWDTAGELYPGLGAVPNLSNKTWTFPSGATVRFSHLQHESDVYAWQGSQVSLFVFDELTHFQEKQFFYMLSRNRSTCGVRPYVRGTCNPDAGSWVAGFLGWWIDKDTGFPVPERAGKLRYFYRQGDEIRWFGSPAEAEAGVPDLAALAPPKSVTFCPAKLSDNAILTAKDPGYLANLLALPYVERARLLDGNWKVTAADGLFRAEWFPEPVAPTALPQKWVRRVRAWDLACLVPGTLVDTARGGVPIEDVRADDFVLTRLGYRRVRWAGPTRVANELVRVRLGGGAELTGTADHRVWTENRGWVELGSLRPGDACVSAPGGRQEWRDGKNQSGGRTPRSSSSKGLLTRGDPESGTSRRTVGTVGGTAVIQTLCTGPFGGRLTAPSHPATTSTTRTGITTTTPWTTWSVSPSLSTSDSTTTLRSGTAPPRQTLPAGGPARLDGRRLRTSLTPVLSVERVSNPVGSTYRRSIARHCVGHGRATSGGVLVYDLEVEDAHEFFANGILVHNCTEVKDGNDPDYTVGVLMGLDDQKRYWVLDVKRARVSPSKVEQLILGTAKDDGPAVQVAVEQEPGAAGKIVADRLRTLLSGFNVVVDRPDKTTGDKVQRAFGLSSACEKGQVWLAAGAWVKAFVAELTQFPAKGVHDDQVDASSSAYNRLARGPAVFGPGLGRPEPEYKSAPFTCGC